MEILNIIMCDEIKLKSLESFGPFYADKIPCQEIEKPKARPTWPEYGIALAQVAASRSEDIHTKVGAVAFDVNWNTVGTFYNGFLPKQKFDPLIWQDRDKKNKHIIHAENWLVSKTKNGQVHSVCLTISPCCRCAVLLAAHQVKEVYFGEEYHREQEFKEIFDFYGIRWEKVKIDKGEAVR